ncbi:heavy metal translocating P-type ATPase [Galbibacter mesophilus]|uniref:heavy metal translocating P-type ATPase n=1 Tax=Galbibacter mesophilus TaxID=379069 RepID=UPI00191F42E8|nr:heavy metal translocating P-type ATPase metal-binding domain-containing protein [Galbibacter mesophilus]MCM5664217.1 heavy metal translocating P-type ATPase metal-binding domain-containing protein [Galbibacter mesophilus]
MSDLCFHCGLDCEKEAVFFDDKNFCCNGCKTVYEIFSENDLTSYYDLEKSPGTTPNLIAGKYDFLNNQEIVESLLEFNDDSIQIVNLYIPTIHCSSCIWVLENLHRLHPNVKNAQVDFPKKTIRVTFTSQDFSLKNLVLILASIGYEPKINLENKNTEKGNVDRSIFYKLGIAGFAFGNIMFLSFPEYFEVSEFWLDHYKPFFRWIMFAFSLPVVFYAASDYFIAAYKGLTSKILNIDVPIALGIAVLFIRSCYEIISGTGQGFFDSLSGLVFFLLIGKFFQQKTYSYLSFERSYKSYFPIGVTVLKENNQEESIQVQDVKKGDRILIRNEEIIPVDSILIKGNAYIDYSFVTGESEIVKKVSGDKIFAGGKQTRNVIEIEAVNTVSQSYLTQLWSNEAFKKESAKNFKNVTDQISKYFTVVILLIAFLSLFYWLWRDASQAIYVFTAILIIACPCALALSAPFTLGNLLRIFGKKGFYLKDGNVIEKIAKIDTVIFDKTGTITTPKKNAIIYEGVSLNPAEEKLLKSTLRGSNHPLSRQLYSILKSNDILTLDEFQEISGKGLLARIKDQKIKIGSSNFVTNKQHKEVDKTSVYISTNDSYKGRYVFYNKYRKGVSKLFSKLSKKYELVILSGDNTSEKENLRKLLPRNTKLLFNQQPVDKLLYIKHHQQEGAKIVMIGDGLNDAGALKQSDVGIAVSENVNIFSPACDAILDANKITEIDKYFKACKNAMLTIKASFILSFVYNIIGLSFAVTGHLSPVVAAILMPLSSISIVVFTTLSTNYFSRKLK